MKEVAKATSSDSYSALPSWEQLLDDMTRAASDIALRVTAHRAQHRELEALIEGLTSGIAEVYGMAEKSEATTSSLMRRFQALQQQLEELSPRRGEVQ